MDGILLVDKPSGLTSHDVVAKVRGILRKAASQQSTVGSQTGLSTIDYRLSTPSLKVKVGHTGTLDPFATGLLILVIGKATKRAGEFSKLDKTYQAELVLGQTSTTGDPEGEIRKKEKGKRKKPTRVEVEKVLTSFVGQISQVPPAFSAIKVDGQRAYKLARAGKKVDLKPRTVSVYSLRSTYYRYPKLRIEARVSSGTYIRSLAEDIGAALETGAYLSALRRTQVGDFKIENTSKIEKLTPEDLH